MNPNGQQAQNKPAISLHRGPNITRNLSLSGAALLLVIMTVVAYLPATRCGYVWEDDYYLVENPLLVAPDGLSQIWFSKGVLPQYYPMVFTSFRLEYALWGWNPMGYHITNILLHVINGLLLWCILRCLSIPWAWLAAAIFILHPVQVESVAWITERKNVLMAFFLFPSFLAWIRFVDRSHQRRYAWPLYVLSLLLYALALLSKTTACTMPAAMILSLWIKRVPINVKRWFQVSPYVLLGLAMGMVAFWWEERLSGRALAEMEITLVERVLVASQALWFYIGKLAWPVNLAFSYPHWKFDVNNLLQYGWLFACLIVAWSMWYWRNKFGRGPIAAIVFFVATLSPLLGFIPLYTFFYSYVADHYQYVASIGPISLVAAIGYRLTARLGECGKAIAKIVVVLALVTLGTLTWNQCHIYKDLETLWRDTIRKNPESWLAHNNLGIAISRKGRIDEAARHYRRALQIKPDFAEALSNLGVTFKLRGKLDEAVSYYRKALQFEPGYVQGYYNFGIALEAQGKFDEAISYYRQAIKFKPNYADAHNNLALVLQSQGKFDEAIDHYLHVLRIKPDYTKAHNNLGLLLVGQGRLDQAINHYHRAIEIKPDYAKAHYNLGLVLEKQGKSKEAITHYKHAIKTDPDYAKAHYTLGLALAGHGKLDEAMSHFMRAAQLVPNWPFPLVHIAKIFSTHPNPDRRDAVKAVEFARRAAELTEYKNAYILEMLAAVYAKAGQLDQAVTTAQTAVELASEASDKKLADYLRKQIESYKKLKSPD